jgi:L-histidine N-alpha-methyltransferase
METRTSSSLIENSFAISNYLHKENKEDIIAEIMQGFKAEQKYISSRYFYDDRGSELFEEITGLTEYYPTRTEIDILKNVAPSLMPILKNIDIIELGSGDCSKISILLNTIPSEHLTSVRYIPVDISESAINNSVTALLLQLPKLSIHGLLADFMKHLHLINASKSRLICFFGSTLGNLSRKEACSFLLQVEGLMKSGDRLLLGLDMVKDIQILHDAYNDKRGITAEFNKNILHNVNRYIQTNFNPDYFDHLAYYNTKNDRIEMHLKAQNDMEIYSTLSDCTIRIKKGETIHTENSHKYTQQHIIDFSILTGLDIDTIYSDKQKWFSIVHYRKP